MRLWEKRVRWPISMTKFVIWLLFVSLVCGQLLRLPLPGQGGGLLISDGVVVVVLLVGFVELLTVAEAPEFDASFLSPAWPM